MLPWLIRFWPYILIATVVLGAFFYVQHKAYKKGWDKCQLEHIKSDIEGVKTYDDIHNENRRLSDPDLDSRLAKWMRDAS